MNKTDLIEVVSQKTGGTKRDTEKVVNAVFDTITEELAGDGKVQVVGFGSFEVKSRAARVGRNPKTKEPIDIAASKAPVFKAGKALKDTVNG